MNKNEEYKFVEKQNNEINVLILCSFYTSYVTQLCEYMMKFFPQVKYSLLTHESVVVEYQKNMDIIQNVYGYTTTRTRLFYNQLDNMPSFDIIHSLWMDHIWGINAHILKKKAKYWFNSVGGSDLYRYSRQYAMRVCQKRIIKYSDWISSENVQTRDYFYKVFGEKNQNVKHTICRFGVDILEYIKLFKQNGEMLKSVSEAFPTDKLIVLCGTNAREEHQHIKMIEAISQMDSGKRERCYFVFPMTYPTGKEKYINIVDEKISQVTNSYTILTKYMNVEEMAELAMATDVMIHVQTTDQLSSAMLSHMYNGNLVIVGEWLPYGTLEENSVFFLKVKEIPELTGKLEDVISRIEYYKNKCIDNAEVIYHLSSWEATSKEWMKVYMSLMKGEK